MAPNETHQPRKLAVVLHADIIDSTKLVRRNETIAHNRIKNTFERLSEAVQLYGGTAHELRGDALLAEFHRASDAVSAALAFQAANVEHNAALGDDIQPQVRVGVSLGEVVVSDGTLTGPDVVLAQRLEQLAPPGGVCVSQAAFQSIPERLPFDCEDLGEQKVKGFDKAVRAYSISLRAGEAIPSPESGAAKAKTSPPYRQRRWVGGGVLALLLVVVGALWIRPWGPPLELPEKPSIAVLPFTNMSGDPSQEYFVDGMTEDLITDLAKIKSIFVIARNTMFTFKHKSVVVPEVARELGVKYVLEGSVRRAGDKVRINAQLIDGASGAHLWAERYDGTLADIFRLQDEVTGEIVAELKVTLTPDEQARQERKGTNNPDAHDAYLRGWQLYRRYTPEDFVEAIPHFEQAVELDPEYGQAWAALASVYWTSYLKSYAWTLIVNPNRDNFVSWLETRQKAAQYLENAMRHPTPLAHQVESQMSWDYRQFDRALSEAERALALDPNDPEGHLAMAWALVFSGRAREALASAEKGMQLDPYYPAPHLSALGLAHLMLQEYTEAEAALERALGLNPESKNLNLPLAVTYAHLDKKEAARTALKRYTEFFIYYAPKIETYMQWWPFKREVDMRFFGSGLIEAGLCCDEQLEAYIGRVRQGGTLE